VVLDPRQPAELLRQVPVAFAEQLDGDERAGSRAARRRARFG
jgi:hypothetical protein